MANETIKEMLKMINVKIEHIEDITADNRAVIIKLVTQSNEIVKFLRTLQVEESESVDSYSDIFGNNIEEIENYEKKSNIKVLLDEFMKKRHDLKELEEELKENSDMVTPGLIGEA